MNCSGVISGYSVDFICSLRLNVYMLSYLTFMKVLINKVLGIIFPVQFSMSFAVTFLGCLTVDSIDQVHVNSDLNFLRTIKLIEN